MSPPDDLFDLAVDGRRVKTPIAIAAMAGTVDAAYVAARAEHAGMGFIGGYSIDPPTIAASRRMAESGRCEFLPDDPVSELQRQVDLLAASPVVGGVNLRASTPEALSGLAASLGDRVVYEIDAHCRQAPMVEAGSGEFLLHHPDTLVGMVRALKSEGVLVSVKIRAGVSENDPALARRLWEAGADILHVDLMDAGYAKIRQIRNASPILLIANNSMQSFDRVMEMFSHGADLVSLATALGYPDPRGPRCGYHPVRERVRLVQRPQAALPGRGCQGPHLLLPPGQGLPPPPDTREGRALPG